MVKHVTCWNKGLKRLTYGNTYEVLDSYYNKDGMNKKYGGLHYVVINDNNQREDYSAGNFDYSNYNKQLYSIW